jgi:hypothetical protein
MSQNYISVLYTFLFWKENKKIKIKRPKHISIYTYVFVSKTDRLLKIENSIDCRRLFHEVRVKHNLF